MKRDTVLVTGGASGLGAAIARAFHAAGFNVGIGDIDADGAVALARDLDASGETATGIALDVRDQAAFEAVLGEQGVTLAVTNRDGWSFKMRRIDNGKIGRKKASALTPDFTADAVTEIFRQRAAGITAVPKQPVLGFELDPVEFKQIAIRLKRRMASKAPKTPARERFVRGQQRQHSREYGD